MQTEPVNYNKLIIGDPAVCGGVPIIRGTRKPAAMIAGLRRADSLANITKAYNLTAADVEAAAAFIDAHPEFMEDDEAGCLNFLTEENLVQAGCDSDAIPAVLEQGRTYAPMDVGATAGAYAAAIMQRHADGLAVARAAMRMLFSRNGQAAILDVPAAELTAALRRAGSEPIGETAARLRRLLPDQ